MKEEEVLGIDFGSLPSMGRWYSKGLIPSELIKVQPMPSPKISFDMTAFLYRDRVVMAYDTMCKMLESKNLDNTCNRLLLL